MAAIIGLNQPFYEQSFIFKKSKWRSIAWLSQQV